MSGGTLVIGLCGRSGSGKGYVCNSFLRRGVSSVDTDKVYRELLLDRSCGCLGELVLEFGSDILDTDGNLNRRVLAGKVFGDGGAKLPRLNEITHKYILERTVESIKRAEEQMLSAIIIDAPVLFESGFDKLCHLTVCVTAPDSLCAARIMLRDGISEQEALKRLSNQKSAEELKALCDIEIVNDGVADVDAQVSEVLKKYLQEGK